MKTRKAILVAILFAAIASVGRAQETVTPRAALVESTNSTLAEVAEEALLVWRALASRTQQVETQLRTVKQIKQLGGAVEFDSWGPAWLSPVTSRAQFLRDVVRVQLPGHRADDAVHALQQCPSLKRVTLTYSVSGYIAGSFSITFARYFEIDDKWVDPPSEKERCRRLMDKLPGVIVEIACDGETVSFEQAFIGTRTEIAR